MNKLLNKKVTITFSILSLLAALAFGQDTIPKNIAKKRLLYVGTASAVAYTGSMTALYYAWYAGYPQSKFHLFDDNNEWFQLDKFGHLTTGYLTTSYATSVLRWGGLPNKKAVLYGSASSLLFLTTIEVFDGLSAQWGFSTGDMVADVSGIALSAVQQLVWKEEKIQLKFSYYPSGLAKNNPNLLGKNFAEQWLKDYNGQTFWLSVSPAAFYNRPTKWPKWLCFSFGYGGMGMIGARTNPAVINGNPIPCFNRYRQYYLTMDINLAAIKTKYKGLNTVLRMLNTLKIPFPTLEFNRIDKVRFHRFYF